MSTNKDHAKTEAYKRGLEGKLGSANGFQVWGDDKEDRAARREGYEEGKRDRARIKAERNSTNPSVE
jgi:hypothetical protein